MQGILDKVAEDIRLRGLSEHTLRSYTGNIGRYLDFLGGRPVAETSEADIRNYSAYLREVRGLSEKSINTYLAGVLFMYEVTLDRPMNRRQIPYMKEPKDLPAILTRDELATLMDATTNLKHRALFSLGYGSGLRVSEVCKLRTCDVDSDGMRIFVKGGKGKKDRYTILSQATLEDLRAYWRAYRPDHPEGWMFTGPYNYTHIERGACSAALKSSLRKAGIDREGVSFHTLRHCFGTYLLEDGCDLMRIKELMGHASLSTTAVYLHLANTTRGVVSPLDARSA